MAADIEKEDEAILQATAGEQHEQTIVSDRVKFIDAIYDVFLKIDGFTVVKSTFEEEPCLLIAHQTLHSHPPLV